MKFDISTSKIIRRRSFIVIFVSFFIFTIISLRLFVIQIVRGKNYAKKSNENRLFTKITPPLRGDIFASNGELVAGTISNYSFVISKYLNNNFFFELQSFKSLIYSDLNLELITNKLNEMNKYSSTIIIKNASWDQIVKFEKNKFLFSSIEIKESKKRYYPFNNISQIIGYMSESKLKSKQFPVGAFHIEKQFNFLLKGTSGQILNEVNAFGRVVRTVSSVPSKKGNSLELSINLDLQNYCQSLLPDNKKGSLIVMKVDDGSILSLNSNPTFNSQDFEDRLSEKINFYLNDTNNPMINRAFSGFYPPGSAFKPLPALLGLEKNLIDENSNVFCSGHSSIGPTNYYCWKKGGHGKVNLKKAIKESCDVFFYELAKKINIDDLSSLSLEMGYNQIFDIGLSNKGKGLIPNTKWKKKYLNDNWYQGETLITCIGQGFTQASPIQLAVHYNSIINNGIYPLPKILKNTKPQYQGRLIKKQFTKILLNSLSSVVNEQRGTANHLMKKNPNFIKIGGKTGTSQVYRIKESDRENDLYKDKTVAENLQDHSVFVGYGPVDNPKYIASVIIENGGSGSKVAAPIAHYALNEAEKLNV